MGKKVKVVMEVELDDDELEEISEGASECEDVDDLIFDCGDEIGSEIESCLSDYFTVNKISVENPNDEIRLCTSSLTKKIYLAKGHYIDDRGTFCSCDKNKKEVSVDYLKDLIKMVA